MLWWYDILVAVCLMTILMYGLHKTYAHHAPEKFRAYLINLPRHTERMRNFKHHFQNTKKPPPPLTVVQAVDAQEMKHTPLFTNWPGMLNTPTHHNYKALQLSVIKCLEIAQKAKVEWAIICEDDAELPPDIDFQQIVSLYPDSKVIYLDDRNGLQPKELHTGDGMVPGCCMNCVMYHNSVLNTFIKELHPHTGKHFQEYIEQTQKATLNDWLIPWLITYVFRIKCSSHAVVNGHNFQSTITVSEEHRTHQPRGDA